MYVKHDDVGFPNYNFSSNVVARLKFQMCEVLYIHVWLKLLFETGKRGAIDKACINDFVLKMVNAPFFTDIGVIPNRQFRDWMHVENTQGSKPVL